jgi:pimeloyl-ACP methyl ester carboxylesterase
VFVVEEGPPDGPPILLLHGYASSLRAWDRVVPLLDGFRVIRLDLLGHGRSGGGAAAAGEQAAAGIEVLRDRDLTDVTVVGHSFGADVAIALGADPRVSRVVVVTQGPDYIDANVPRARFLTARPALTRRLHRGVRPALAVAGTLLQRSRRPLPRLVANACRDIGATDPAMLRLVLTDRREDLLAEPLDVRLAALGKPALVILGSRDRLYGDRSAARYRAAGARVEIVADSTHAMPQQHPAAIASLVRTFV